MLSDNDYKQEKCLTNPGGSTLLGPAMMFDQAELGHERPQRQPGAHRKGHPGHSGMSLASVCKWRRTVNFKKKL